MDAARDSSPRAARAIVARGARAGFSLVETIIALVLSSIVMVLVSGTFLVQNRQYAAQIQAAGAHDNARVATELIGREIRSAMEDGLRVAGRRTLTVRSPMVLGAVCDRTGFFDIDLNVHTEGGEAWLDTDEVAGVAMRDGSGDWTYRNASWSSMNGSNSGAAGGCAANGADTTGARNEFHEIKGLPFLFLFGDVPEVGELIMLFRETTFTIEESDLEPGTLAIFRQVYGESPVEFATGIDTTAHFEFRTGGTTYADTVGASSVDDIDAVRIVAAARKRSESGTGRDATFGWAVNVPLRNVP